MENTADSTENNRTPIEGASQGGWPEVRQVVYQSPYLNEVVTLYKDAVAYMAEFELCEIIGGDTFGLQLTRSESKEILLMPVDPEGKCFGLIFIFDDIYVDRPTRLYVNTASLCPSLLKVKESFAVPEDRKWCVVMSLSDEYHFDTKEAWCPCLAFEEVFVIKWQLPKGLGQ